MRMLLIAFDLTAKDKEYEHFFQAIKGETGNWWHYANVWLVLTPRSAQEVADGLRQFMTPEDSLFVIEVKRDYRGYLPPKAWEWLKQKTFS